MNLCAAACRWNARRNATHAGGELRAAFGDDADPTHPADKEHLERIIGRARSAGLPAGLPCVRPSGDAVSGDITRADLVPAEGPDLPADEDPTQPHDRAAWTPKNPTHTGTAPSCSLPC